MILLSGLFFYDIFWVFGTEVMVSVAKNFDAPIKVIWPKNIIGVLAGTVEKTEFTMLGLGDIVIPGKRTGNGVDIVPMGFPLIINSSRYLCCLVLEIRSPPSMAPQSFRRLPLYKL
jgi:hypothetical protein